MLKLTDFFKVEEGEVFDLLNDKDERECTFVIRDNKLHSLIPSNIGINKLNKYNLKKFSNNNISYEFDKLCKLATNMNRKNIIPVLKPDKYEPYKETNITLDNTIKFSNKTFLSKYKFDINQLTVLKEIYKQGKYKYLTLDKYEEYDKDRGFPVWLHSEVPYCEISHSDTTYWDSNGSQLELVCYSRLFKDIPTDAYITLSDYSSEFEQLENILNKIQITD